MEIMNEVTQRRRNAVTLLSFMASILEKHNTLLEKIFWAGSDVSLSKSVKMLFQNFRTIVETDRKDSWVEVSF